MVARRAIPSHQETFCCFCSGPLANVNDTGIRTGEDTDDSSSEDEVQENDIDESNFAEIAISNRDRAVWEKYVRITPQFPETFVSPPCHVDDDGLVSVDGSETNEWETDEWEDHLLIHSVCLAFICRHNSITPEQLWDTIFGVTHGLKELNGQITGIDYYEIAKICQKSFDYDAFAQSSESKTETSHDLAWLLTRPTYLPTPRELQLVTTMDPTPRSGHKLFDIPELFGYILDQIAVVPNAVIESELKPHTTKCNQRDGNYVIFEAPSAITAAKTLLSLAQVNRSFYHTIMGSRQDLFLQAMRNFGWMLPFTPADWIDSEWPDAVLNGNAISLASKYDWRAYMLSCLRRGSPSLRNRWRLHKVAVQFARGQEYRSAEGRQSYWKAGTLASKPDLEKSEAKGWEVGVQWW
ncbi:hypothetical protein FPOAC2_13029 [Fusarium poae]|uniref:hypothetical protein n=1 Tax=Fusarium poae TaxID=36050 RepID=UPI001CEB0C2A|nr:hypothetical protein FPOAC1_012667 [Fusarium poae]KAG8667828.1 hypothetical protein FPOAC1_012667 [Fusarium poae]